MQKEHYGAIDGLRAIACIGIVMMHVKANTDYNISGFIFNRLIPSFTDFVFLFMVISAFGMCCGYLEKVLNNSISMEDFYIKRYSKILPFFSLLVLIDIIYSPSKASLIEGFADVTLLFGLFPNNISVIGVGWFLGLVFAFYLIFPFYCVLLKSKKRAWGAFIISLVLNYICATYFDIGRTNIVYSLCYFIAGGLVYLYRDMLKVFSQKYHWLSFLIIILSIILFFVIGSNTITLLLISASMLIYSIGCLRGVLQNRFTKFLSSISMEIYLSHMMAFRIIEKGGMIRLFSNGIIGYVIVTILTICIAVLFTLFMKKIYERLFIMLNKTK